MEPRLREYHIKRIIADILPFTYNDRIYYLSSPTPEFKFYAEKIYCDTYIEALKETILEEDIIILLSKYNLWTDKEETSFNTLKEELENTKVCLYENFDKTDKVPIYKKVLHDIKNELSRLYLIKSSMNQFTAEHIAETAKQNFLLGASILLPNKKRLWKTLNGWDKSNKIIDCAFEALRDNTLNDISIREIVKNESWKTTWAIAKRAQNIFKRSVGEFSEDQRNITIWSIIYDNVLRSQDKPSSDIIEDDDALDGWMIIERRKRERDEGRSIVEKKLTNDKIRNAQEVFIISNSDKQNKQIVEMNDFAGKVALKSRLRQIQKEGTVTEANLHDTRQQMQMRAAEHFSQGLRHR